MELNSENVSRFLYPLAAFENPSIIPARSSSENEDGLPTTWGASILNPKNRIDSLAEPPNAKWRVNGSTNMGMQFYTIPVFLTHPIPMRIDTFIPERKDIPIALQAVLDIRPAFYTRHSRVAQLGISRYIVRVLDHWSEQIPDFAAFYRSLPFGSRIVLQNIETDIRSVKIQVLQTHFLERQLLSVSSLQALWQKIPSDSWPAITDISNITLLQQLHDSVSLVLLAGKKQIMKSLTSSPKYLYHELKILLHMAPHPNIITRPSHLVVKKCNFGSKIAVVGFIIAYHPAGTLRDTLSFRGIDIQQQVRWAIQLTEALVHIRDQGVMYCDLRPDNIVLDTPGDAIRVIDFEGRGVGTFMSAPEITYLEYISSLAFSSELETGERERFRRLYESVTRGKGVPATTEIYRNPEHGYCVSWLCLSEEEREAAQVYMLGKVLWCIFEGVGTPEKGVVVAHLREGDLEFPDWRRTPMVIRELIERCCLSGRRCERFPLVRKGGFLCLRYGDGMETREQVQAAAVRWWTVELGVAEEFLARRSADVGKGVSAFSLRPKLQDVLDEIKSFEKSLGV